MPSAEAPKSPDYETVPQIRAELKAADLYCPDDSTLRRWLYTGKIRAVRVGLRRTLVSRQDVFALCTPKPIEPVEA